MDKTYCVTVSATPYTGLLAFLIFLELAAYLAAHRTPIRNRGPWVEVGPGFWTRAWRTMLHIIGWHLAATADPYPTRRRHPYPRVHQRPAHHCPHQQGNRLPARHTRRFPGTSPSLGPTRPRERRTTRMVNQLGSTLDQRQGEGRRGAEPGGTCPQQPSPRTRGPRRRRTLEEEALRTPLEAEEPDGRDPRNQNTIN
ncbi:hypothetical protein C8F01DRAFT_1083807 [Mycena amicta]|nr:hypothetical protein C8F01DRAFT_1083807 [Mycena amicta]